MPTPRTLLSALGACAVFLLTAHGNLDSLATLSAQNGAKAGNPITGEGLPNPVPKVTRNWGQLPAGRKWGLPAQCLTANAPWTPAPPLYLFQVTT